MARLTRLVLLIVSTFAVAQPVQAQVPATVAGVVDGDTLDVRLADANVVRVRLIGIDTPERGRCGFAESKAHMERIALGRIVTLVADPSQGAIDSYGRSLYYVDRDDAVDLGLEMVRAGWAQVYVYDPLFQRHPAYVQAEAEALGGVWRLCDGDFALSGAEVQREDAEAFMEHWYTLVSERRFQRAWRLLNRRVRRGFGSFASWKAGHRTSLDATVLSARARLSGGRAVVAIHLRSRDRDVCSGRVVKQLFRGTWILAPRRGSWIVTQARMRKAAGGRVRLSRSDCVPRAIPPPAPRPAPPTNCQGYSPCITPGPDVDCAGGSGNGPRYLNGPVAVNGSDPYGLDSDGDGLGCE